MPARSFLDDLPPCGQDRSQNKATFFLPTGARKLPKKLLFTPRGKKTRTKQAGDRQTWTKGYATTQQDIPRQSARAPPPRPETRHAHGMGWDGITCRPCQCFRRKGSARLTVLDPQQVSRVLRVSARKELGGCFQTKRAGTAAETGSLPPLQEKLGYATRLRERAHPKNSGKFSERHRVDVLLPDLLSVSRNQPQHPSRERGRDLSAFVGSSKKNERSSVRIVLLPRAMLPRLRQSGRQGFPRVASRPPRSRVPPPTTTRPSLAQACPETSQAVDRHAAAVIVVAVAVPPSPPPAAGRPPACPSDGGLGSPPAVHYSL